MHSQFDNSRVHLIWEGTGSSGDGQNKKPGMKPRQKMSDQGTTKFVELFAKMSCYS